MTPEQTARLVEYLDTHELSKGLGSEESACMVAAINLAISGGLTDTIPPCMSRVIGLWGIVIQDAMPADMRNSHEFKSLIPIAAGTGRNLEKQRAAIALDWMWTNVLPQLQPIADAGGFGAEWAKMITEKTARAAYAAADAADAARAAADAAAYAAARATYAARAATYAARAAAYAADAADAATYAARATYAYAADAADAAARATYAAAAYAADAARAAADAADAARAAADAAAYAANAAAYAADADFWVKADPISCLKQMIEVTE